MKQTDRFYTIFILLIVGAGGVTAQESTLRMAKVQERKIIFVASKERTMPNLIFARDNQTQMQGIVVKSAGQLSRLFLENLETGQRTLIDEYSTTSKNPAMRLSGGDRYICYNVYDPDRTVSFRIYDIQTREVIHVKRPDGNVAYPDVNPVNAKILYQMRAPGQWSKVYLADKVGENPQFIEQGSGAKWSPDGKWFYLLHASPKAAQTVSTEKKRLSTENLKKRRRLPQRREPVKLSPRKLDFFDLEANFQFDVELAIDPADIVWSPQSDKLVFRDLRDKEGKIYLLTFKTSENSLQLEKAQELLRVTSEGEYFLDPVWSPDGKMLLFQKYKDAHYNIENIDVVLFNIKTRSLVNVTKTLDIFERAVSWNTDGTIFIKKEAKGLEPSALESIKLDQ